MKWLGVLLALVLGLYGLYLYNFPSYSHRYRLIVEIEADGEIRQASNVVEVTIREEPIPGRGRLLVPSVRGEAIFVDIGKNRNIVALLSFPARANGLPPVEPYMLARIAFDLPPHANDIEAYRKLESLRGSTELAGSLIPRMITLTNITDPTTIKPIQPEKLQQHFGGAVHLRRVSIELTNDSFTPRIERQLGWISQFNLYRTDRQNPFTNTLPIRIEDLKRS